MCLHRIQFAGLFFISTVIFGAPVSAAPVSIGFDGISPGINNEFVGHTEDGFVVSPLNGNLSVDIARGPAPPEVHRTISTSGGGALSIIAEPIDQHFVFVSLDIAEFDSINQSNFMIQVAGFADSVKVAEEFYSPLAASGLGAYQTVGPGSFTGVMLDELRIVLPGDSASYARIDNIVLDKLTPIPVPPALLLLSTGMLSLLGWRTKQA